MIALGHIGVDLACDEPAISKLLHKDGGKVSRLDQLIQGRDRVGVALLVLVSRKVPVDVFGKQEAGQREYVVVRGLDGWSLESTDMLASSPCWYRIASSLWMAVIPSGVATRGCSICTYALNAGTKASLVSAIVQQGYGLDNALGSKLLQTGSLIDVVKEKAIVGPVLSLEGELVPEGRSIGRLAGFVVQTLHEGQHWEGIEAGCRRDDILQQLRSSV